MQLKRFFCGVLFFLVGCGFSPLYNSNVVSYTEKIAIEPISNFEGYILYQRLDDALNPSKRRCSKDYTLSVSLGAPVYSDQSIQGDNFASRKKISLTARFVLKDKKTQKVLLTGHTTALGAYNVYKEAYSTYQAKEKQNEELARILAENISLRVGSFFKQEFIEVEREGKANTN